MTRIRAMSYNVRYANRNDHHDAWYARRDAVAGLVRFHRPDVVGFQEPLPGQRDDLRERLPEYAFVGRGRRANDEGEGCPVAVRTDRWTIVDDGTVWLSETPEEPSIGWDASYPRIATWARVEPRNAEEAGGGPDRPFLVVNTHLDHEGARAREEAARLLRERIPDLVDDGDDGGGSGDGDGTRVENDVAGSTERGGHPNGPSVVLLGDFNCTAGSPPHQILTDPDAPEREISFRDAATAADVRHGPTTSITDFAELIDGRRIDHVLVSPDVDVEAFAPLADRDDRGRYPSDHLPVLARLHR
ncbi:endonuclease/exonuclease/phosphatase family protein [Halorubrum sp. DTA98]|uniref:endonuclease/exonuclease/phosphatase family protein n=1 Tax=Halorubrum sp. DTA98 TaxID=3402163 RepID=UPI003AAF42E4